MSSKISKFKLLFFIILISQAYLITHRTGFDFKILFNFSKKNTGIERSIKEQSVIKIGNFLKKNKQNFYLDKEMLKEVTGEYNYTSKNIKFYLRLIEYAYPLKLDSNSKIIISDNEKYRKCKKIFNYKKKFIYDCK